MSEARKVAVVTGGNRGIGLETCRQLAERGLHVVLGSRDEAAGRAEVGGTRFVNAATHMGKGAGVAVEWV